MTTRRRAWPLDGPLGRRHARRLPIPTGPRQSHSGGWGTENIWGGVPRGLYGFTCGMVYECLAALKTTKINLWFSKVQHKQTVLCLSLLMVFAFPFGIR